MCHIPLVSTRPVYARWSRRLNCRLRRLAGLPNGELNGRAVAAGFDVIVSLDRGIPQQQNLPRHGIAFVLIPDNEVDLIRP